jgi:hypothetical protein
MPPKQMSLAAQEWNFLLNSTRARVYLLWAIIVPLGFLSTHFYQNHNINAVWFMISLLGLVYMYRVMPIKQKMMKRILLAWLVPIAFGMAVSGAVFYVRGANATNLIAHLGAFWLLVMAAGYFLNGLADPPSKWYWFNAALNLAVGIACFTIDAFTGGQYLIAAAVSAWSMSNLWLFRSLL